MNRPCRTCRPPMLAGLLAGIVLVLGEAHGQQVPAALIRVNSAGKPEVVPVYWLQSPEMARAAGLLVWPDRSGEAWQVIPPTARAPYASDTLSMVSRFAGPARGGTSGAGPVSNMVTVQLDQLIGQVVFRGEGFLTPTQGGYHLNPKITIRRQPGDGPAKYPAATLQIKQAGKVLVRIPVKEGQAAIAWSEIPDLPDSLKEGLAPGECTLAEEGGGASTTFFVEAPEVRAWVMEIPDELERLLGTRQHPLYLQVAASHVLAQVDENGRPRPYTSDALEMLEAAPAKVRTPYIEHLRDDVLARLEGPQSGEQATEKSAGQAAETSDPTGIAPVDAARGLILAGKWDAALAQLDSPELGGEPRSRALAALYRAVVLSESGQATEGATQALFRQAIDGLEGNPADVYRARNNYANALLTRAQDRLYNHAFQIATGVPYPLIRALMDWRESLAQYEAALTLAKGLGPEQQAAVEVNIARLYALLADVILTLAPAADGESGFAAGYQAAADRAGELASAVLKAPDERTDPVVRAASHEILAQLAFRSGDAPACRENAEQAIREHLQAGALAGVESGHRTLGLLSLREAASSDDPARTQEARKAALNHLLISHVLSEFLREQIPADRIGLGRAGFFARRAYVNEQICRLLVDDGKPAEALRYVELAKARALQDVLAVGVHEAAGRVPEPRELSEILAEWPKDVAALEYFLGTEQAWVFLVDSSGKVTARVLTDDLGRPLASRDLVARVRSFLARIDHQAEQMRERLDAGMGYDPSWQYELYDFSRQLLPKGVLDELRKAKTVLVVPHHILHYFPFVALVTQPDTSRRSIHEMVKPRFLLDEPFHLAYAPSLAAWDLLREQPDRPIRQVNASGIVEFQSVQPLPGVEKDLANLKATFGPMVDTVLSGEDASETRAKAIFNRSGLLFLATHGKNYADQPLSGYLMFHPDDKSDGYLTAGEIYSIDVAADLVVMSACYSGLADRSPLPGDDLFGLQRALLHAGARTVVSGLWDVYDGTGPELMRVFFQQLAAGKPAPEALANSQRDLLSRMRASREVEPWLHPYFWAVYTTVGDDRTRVEVKAE